MFSGVQRLHEKTSATALAMYIVKMLPICFMIVFGGFKNTSFPGWGNKMGPVIPVFEVILNETKA
jgi:hypothetical protein